MSLEELATLVQADRGLLAWTQAGLLAPEG